MPTLTYGERLEKLDLEVGELQRGFLEAVERIRGSGHADGSFQENWEIVARRMKDLRTEISPEDYDKEQFTTLTTALFDIRDLLDRSDAAENLDVSDQLLIRLERIRHVVRDALDEHVDGAAGDVGLVMADVERWLAHVPDRKIAELIGVDRRTLSRWRHSRGAPRRELRVFARLVAVLRHNWDEEGIVAWFYRPRRELGGRKPANLLADPNAEDALLSAARSGRSQYAT